MRRHFVTVLLLTLAFLARPVWAQSDDPVQVSAKASRVKVAPGDTLALAVVFDFEQGWHIHTNAPVAPDGVDADTLIPTRITVKAPDGVVTWPIQWPKTHEIMYSLSGPPKPYRVFEGHSAAYIPVQVPPTATIGSSLEFSITVTFQACNDRTCLMESEYTLPVVLPVVALADAAGASVQDADFIAFDPTAFSQKPCSGTVAASSSSVKFALFGWSFTVDTAGLGFILLLIVAALGGFLLNLTPCVLPVIPLKIMGLSQAAGNPARCFLLGAVMSLGVVAFWMLIGGAIAFVSGFTAINTLFQTPWFSLAVGAFILAMAAGMLGAFTVRLPQVAYLVNPSHDTLPGSFAFGIMTAILSTPCTAPFMGSAAAWAAKQSPVVTLATFAAIGAGMALPYLILSAFPALLSRMPRTGPASELIKQVIGLLMVAVAFFFLGTGLDPLMREPIDPPVRFFWWVIAAAAVGAMAWLVYRTFQITRRAASRIFWTGFAAVFGLATVSIAIMVTDRGPIPWIGYTPERFAAQLKNGKTVVLDFTAEWCLNCKAQEAAVLHREEIVKLLTSELVVPMRVDLTGKNLPGKAKLNELGWVGIPLLAFYGPGLKEPIMYDTYTVAQVKEALAKATNGGSAPVVSAEPVAPAVR